MYILLFFAGFVASEIFKSSDGFIKNVFFNPTCEGDSKGPDYFYFPGKCYLDLLRKQSYHVLSLTSEGIITERQLCPTDECSKCDRVDTYNIDECYNVTETYSFRFSNAPLPAAMGYQYVYSENTCSLDSMEWIAFFTPGKCRSGDGQSSMFQCAEDEDELQFRIWDNVKCEGEEKQIVKTNSSMCIPEAFLYYTGTCKKYV